MTNENESIGLAWLRKKHQIDFMESPQKPITITAEQLQALVDCTEALKELMSIRSWDIKEPRPTQSVYLMCVHQDAEDGLDRVNELFGD